MATNEQEDGQMLNCLLEQPLDLSPELLSKLNRPEWCGCCIENWATFAASNGRPCIRSELYSYNYVLIPDLRITNGSSAVHFNLFAYESFSRSPFDVPPEKHLELCFVHASDSTRDMEFCVDVSWNKLYPPMKINGEEVYFIGTINFCVDVRIFEAGSFVKDDRLHLLFKAKP